MLSVLGLSRIERGNTSLGGELLKITSMKTKLISPVPFGIPDTSIFFKFGLWPFCIRIMWGHAPVQIPSQKPTFYTRKAESPGFPGSLRLSQGHQVFQILRKA